MNDEELQELVDKYVEEFNKRVDENFLLVKTVKSAMNKTEPKELAWLKIKTEDLYKLSETEKRFAMALIQPYDLELPLLFRCKDDDALEGCVVLNPVEWLKGLGFEAIRRETDKKEEDHA